MGLTLKQFADEFKAKVGPITFQSLDKYECAKSEMSAYRALQLCHVADMPLSRLYASVLDSGDQVGCPQSVMTEKEFYVSLGKFIELGRLDWSKPILQKELGQAVGIKFQQVSKNESGEDRVRVFRYILMTDFIGYTRRDALHALVLLVEGRDARSVHDMFLRKQPSYTPPQALRAAIG